MAVPIVMLAAICPTPTPAPTGAPVVIVCGADPWSWSLDTTVAALGAAATIIVAVFALVATNRANRLEVQARERAGRVAMSSAVDAYLSVWEAEAGDEESVQSRAAFSSLRATAAGVSLSAEAAATWVLLTLGQTMRLIDEEHKSWPPKEREWARKHSVSAVGNEVRRRITLWVATGNNLVLSPLLEPLPSTPPFPATDKSGPDAP